MNIYYWTCENRLSLNILKTDAIIFSNWNNSENIPINLQMDQQFIGIVENEKFIGVTIDCEFSQFSCVFNVFTADKNYLH